MPRPRLLGALLCYNDGDILADNLTHLLNNNHDLVIWNHGSDDETRSVLETFRNDLLEVTNVSRDVDFYKMYGLLSKHLLSNYTSSYDWISWPDQDEILEGPGRDRPYHLYLEEAFESPYDWVRFNDLLYWYTAADDPQLSSPSERVRHYALFQLGPQKIRSWRASATNIRWFNHNAARGAPYPAAFNLRHYPMRSASQMRRRLLNDRAGLRRGPVNSHYELMKSAAGISVEPSQLHYDDGKAALQVTGGFDWTAIYGRPPRLPRAVNASYLLSTIRFNVGLEILRAFEEREIPVLSNMSARIETWMEALKSNRFQAVSIDTNPPGVTLATEQLAQEWENRSGSSEALIAAGSAGRARICVGDILIQITGENTGGSISLQLVDPECAERELPLVMWVPYFQAERPTLHSFCDGFLQLSGLRRSSVYVLVFETMTREEPAPAAEALKLA